MNGYVCVMCNTQDSLKLGTDVTCFSLVLEVMSAVRQVSAVRSCVAGETTLQRYCDPSVMSVEEDIGLPVVSAEDIGLPVVSAEDIGLPVVSAEDTGLPMVSAEEDMEVPVVSAEDIGLPVKRHDPATIQPCALSDMSSRRRHWLTRLKSCTDVSEMLAILEDLRKVIPGLDDSEVVNSTRSELVELLEAFKIYGKQYKKKRKVITKTSRKVLSQVVKKTFSKKAAKKN